MSEELERTRKALGEAIAWLQQLSTLGGTSSVGNEMAREGLDKVEALLNPPPEFEDMPLERWAIVAPSGFVELTVSSRNLAEEEVSEDGRYPNYQLVRLTGSVKRPVKKPVVREVEVRALIRPNGEPIPLDSPHDYLFHSQQEIIGGKTVTLIARWTE